MKLNIKVTTVGIYILINCWLIAIIEIEMMIIIKVNGAILHPRNSRIRGQPKDGSLN